MLKKNLPLLFFNKSCCLGVRKGKCPQNAKIIFLTQVLPGCDCCEVDGKLVSDGFVWMRGNQTFGEAFEFLHFFINFIDLKDRIFNHDVECFFRAVGDGFIVNQGLSTKM